MKIIFLGVQGSGKSTQAKLLAGKLSLPYIEMGQLFRDKAEETSELGKLVKNSLEKGELVPDEIAVKLLKQKLDEEQFANGFILDGYPRNQAQMDGLSREINKVFYVKVSDNEAIRRLTLRGRHDDTEELLKRRLEIYHEKTEPLLDQFRKKGVLTEINGEKSIDEINNEISKTINK